MKNIQTFGMTTGWRIPELFSKSMDVENIIKEDSKVSDFITNDNSGIFPTS